MTTLKKPNEESCTGCQEYRIGVEHGEIRALVRVRELLKHIKDSELEYSDASVPRFIQVIEKKFVKSFPELKEVK